MDTREHYPLYETVIDGKPYRAYQMPFHNLYDTLEATASRFPDKVGIIDASRQITYAQLKSEVDSLSAYLYYKCGIREKSRVAVLMVNSIDFCLAFYAILRLGAAVVSINTKLSKAEITFLFGDSRPEYAFIDAQWYDKAVVGLQEAGARGCILSGSDNQNSLPSIPECVRIGAALPIPPAAVDVSLPAEIMYTSGTTGKPKAAVMTHFNLMQGFYSYAEADNLDNTASTVLSIPVFHITGLNCVLTLFVFLGGLLILLPYFDAEKTLDRMTEFHVNYIHAVSTVYILLDAAISERHDLSSLRDALCGGGFISEENIRRFCAKAPNCRFHPVYGMTETSGAGSYTVGHCLDSSVQNSCGRTVENCEICVMDDNGNVLPAGENGEICFRGAFIISHYLDTRDDFNIINGWLHSGDIGCFDRDGNLYIKDRSKDMINRGGEKIFSLSVEAAIMRFGHIQQAAVFAVDDSLYGEVPGAVIVPQDDDEVDLAELIRYLRSNLAHYKVPVYWEQRSFLPRTANEKVLKRALRLEFNRAYAK